MLIKKTNSANFSIWLLLLVLFFFSNLHAQSYIADIRKLSVEDGLSNRFVRSFYKDHRGFMWIGTEYGLNRYDGYTFKQYTTVNSGLTSNRIRRIRGTDEQLLWLRTQGGVSILDLRTDSIRSFDVAFKESVPFSAKDIKYISPHTMKELWIVTKQNAIYRYHQQQFEFIFNIPKIPKLSLLHANEQFFWLHFPEKILKMTIQGELVKEIDLSENTVVLNFDDNDTLWLYETEEKKLLSLRGLDDYVNTFDLKASELPEETHDSFYHKIIQIHPVNNLIYWPYGKDRKWESLFLLDPRKGVVLDLKSELETLYSYESTSITELYFDRKDQLWVAMEDGIFIITLKKNKFTTLLSSKSEANSIRGMISDKQGNFYINTQSRRIHISPENKKTIYEEGDIGTSAIQDKEGNLWFGSRGSFLEKYNPLSGKRRILSRKNQFKPDELGMLCDKTGRIWIGSNPGLYFIDPDTYVYREFEQYNDFSQLGESVIYHFYEDEKGIWIGASSGLYLLEPGRGITARYAKDAPPPYHIPYDFILHLHRDTEGVFWLASRGGGLIRFNPYDGSYRQFTTTEGLSSNIIYAVYEDAYNRLWLPSNYGLMLFDKKDYGVRTYFKSDGIAHNEFNTFSHYRDEKGLLYFGGLSGITVIDPENFVADVPVPAPLRVTGCKVLNGKTGALINKTIEVQASKGLELRPSETSVILEFALLNYKQSRENNYSYRIEGLDQAWSTIEGTNSLRLSGLPYGNYTLQIKGQDSEGIVSGNELRIPIVVHAPFYFKSSFILGSLFVLGLLIYGIFRWRLQQLKQAKIRLQETVWERTKEISLQKEKIEIDKNIIEKQSEKLKELDRVKSRFFANISHELRTPLTLMLGPLSTLRENLKNTKNIPIKEITNPLVVMQRNGKKLLQLIEEILDLSKLEARKLKLREEPVVFYDLINRLYLSFESYARSRNIKYHFFYIPDKELQLLLDIPKTEKIIINFLSNAFKYSPDGASITLSVTTENTMIRVTVEDTGNGIHPDDLPYIFDRFYQSEQAGAALHGGTGIGLALCKELATLMGGEVTVESKEGERSSFSYSWPKKEITMTPLKEKKDLLPAKDPEEIWGMPLLPNKDPAESPVTNDDTKETYTVLVVEDHKDMRNFIVENLSKHYRTEAVGDGEKAIALLEEKESLPDIIISDVMMPNMDGFALLERIKQHPVWRMLPVILLTARSAQEDRLQGLTMGVNDYLTKPFDMPELLARIQNLLINYEERKQWQDKENIEPSQTSDTEEKLESWNTVWLRRAREIVQREIVNSKHKVSDLAAEMLISERQLLKKMKQITGLTPNAFIREIKLEKARVLLENKVKRTVSEVAYSVGFDTPEYFSTVYKKRYGKRPLEYLSDS